ncbi:pyridoxal-dependent aspartate 1-decarboxylase PanP [Pseudobacteriovorax antillogorgiicola]|uniref:pyridoxal-dependent aspartate 1-decarboxylase PanP n=1 Tax=Pseudobacteriovorax antillogorgiicola TaxID=1513793 RepID=UPI00399A36C7
MTGEGSILSQKPDVTLETLHKIFTIPESEDSTLGQIEKKISENLLGFLKEHIVSAETTPANLERMFREFKVPEDPVFVSEQAEFLLNNVVSQSVHTASPRFVGHMTSALPYFMLPLSKMMIALNQNLVKIETSKSFTPLERQVIGMVHHLIYGNSTMFYKRHTQDHEVALGTFCSNGTIANITSLWVALNKCFPPRKDFAGVSEDGLHTALQEYEKDGAVILVSQRGHYSLSKAANLLGIGKRNLISIPTDDRNKIQVDVLREQVLRFKQENKAIIAIVGIAGTTETGSVDPLSKIADLCQAEDIHFHVDAAWGGPTLFSSTHRSKLRGIETADSVTFDAHKQLYVPMGAAFAVFRDKGDLACIEHHAEYIIRKGSRDLGRKSLEGSRPGMAMLVHSGFRIIGRRGYEMLIDMGIDKAQLFAKMIQEAPDFELITKPELNILTYRYVPENVQKVLGTASYEEQRRLNDHLNRLTVTIQKEQRDKGKNFVSRTALQPVKYDRKTINVFRVVLANPLTKEKHLLEILDEQRKIARTLMRGESWSKTGT